MPKSTRRSTKRSTKATVCKGGRKAEDLFLSPAEAKMVKERRARIQKERKK